MILVQRKSDGLFYTNRDFHSRRHHPKWTANPNECKPFVNEAGARASFYASCFVSYRTDCDCWKAAKANGSRCYVGFRCKHTKERAALIRAKFDSLYDIVPVRVEVKP